MLERIEIDPRRCGGTPVVKGTRIPVAVILDQLASGETWQSLLEGYPVSFTRANGNVGQLNSDDTSPIARLSFPLAALALGLLLGEVLRSWSIGRTAMRSGKTGQVNADANAGNSNMRPINSG